jgi:hypothetical protein
VPKVTRKFWYLTAIAIFCCASSALADSVYTVTFTGSGDGANLGGVYVYPYDLSFSPSTPPPNGTPTNPYGICDDFVDEISNNESWTATILTLPQLANSSNLSDTKYGAAGVANALDDYIAAAELTTEMVQCSPSGNCVADYNFAVWEVFDPPTAGSCANPSSLSGGAFNNISGSDLANAQTEYCKALTGAENGTYTAAEFPQWEVLTPTGAGPQEFIIDPHYNQNGPALSTPEPATTALLGFGGLGLLGILGLLKRNRVSTN